MKERTISNYYCFLISLTCSVIFFSSYLSLQFVMPLVIFGGGVVLSTKRWLGGGDTKLFAAYSTAILPENLFITVLLILIIGGVVSLCCLIKNKWTKSADRGVPYGVAIVIGSLFGIWMSL
ncbi:A24 family peptidase [Vibrio owensii]|uniref:A24 family peptidase n=1 Tax=Vibrio owensii TaxID=696485 RepID=UPI003AAFFC41